MEIHNTVSNTLTKNYNADTQRKLCVVIYVCMYLIAVIICVCVCVCVCVIGLVKLDREIETV